MALELSADVEGALRTWLRTQTDLTALVSQRIFLGIPKDTVLYPFVTLSRVGGGDDGSDNPMDLPVVSFQVWASNRTSAELTTRTLRGVLRELRSTLIDTGVRCSHIATQSFFQPDPESNKPRYIVSAQLAVIAV